MGGGVVGWCGGAVVRWAVLEKSDLWLMDYFFLQPLGPVESSEDVEGLSSNFWGGFPVTDHLEHNVGDGTLMDPVDCE